MYSWRVWLQILRELGHWETNQPTAAAIYDTQNTSGWKPNFTVIKTLMIQSHNLVFDVTEFKILCSKIQIDYLSTFSYVQ